MIQELEKNNLCFQNLKAIFIFTTLDVAAVSGRIYWSSYFFGVTVISKNKILEISLLI